MGTRPRQVYLPIGEAGPKLQLRKNSERSKENQKICNILQIFAAVVNHLKEPELIPGPASGHSASLSLSFLDCKMGQ